VAYLTAAELQDESAWSYITWSPEISTESDFDTWLATIVTRVAKQVEWRVGTTFYGTSATALEQTILKEAELCLAQYYLSLAAAVIADTSDPEGDGTATNSGDKIRGDARAYKERYEEIMASFAGVKGRKYAAPAATYSETTSESIPELESDIDWEVSG
jgi:hypothetical protein